MGTSRRYTYAFVAALTLLLTTSTLTAVPALAQDSSPERSIAFVVDTSGSMSGSRIEQAKSALHTSVDALPVAAAASLRSFAGS